MTVSTITLKVALELCPSERFTLLDFHSKAGCNDAYLWAHASYFYSSPEFGKCWKNGKSREFHRVETACHICGCKPERNYAGVGNIFILNNGVNDDEILVKTGVHKVRGKAVPKVEYVKNTPRLSRMVLLCKEHIGSYFIYAVKEKTTEKLELFTN